MSKKLSWSAIEFIQKPSSKVLNWFVTVFVFSLFSLILSGFYIPMNVVVSAEGKISSELGEFEILAPRAGVFVRVTNENSYVKENDLIGYIQPRAFSKDQVVDILKSLETTAAISNFDELTKKVIKLQKDFPANKWQLADPELGLPMTQIFSKLSDFQENLKKNQEAIASETFLIKEHRKELAKKITNLKKIDNTKNYAFFIETIQDELRKSSLQVAQIENGYNMKSEANRQSYEDEVRKAILQISNYVILSEIRAPIAGQVYHWVKETKSNVLQNVILGRLTPDNSKLIAKIEVVSRDLPKLTKGLELFYKLEAFPYEKFGTGEGTVIDIKNIKILSSDAPANLPEIGKNIYEVSASVRAPANVATAQIPIGSRFTTEIVTKKTNLTFFILNKIFGDRF